MKVLAWAGIGVLVVIGLLGFSSRPWSVDSSLAECSYGVERLAGRPPKGEDEDGQANRLLHQVRLINFCMSAKAFKFDFEGASKFRDTYMAQRAKNLREGQERKIPIPENYGVWSPKDDLDEVSRPYNWNRDWFGHWR